MKSSSIFGKGYYQLITLNSNSGEPLLRGPLLDEDERELTENPKGNFDYTAKARLLRTFFQVKDNLRKLDHFKKELAELSIDKENRQLISFKKYDDKDYAVINLDEFSDQYQGSVEYPDLEIWAELVDEDHQTVGHIQFYNKNIGIFTNRPSVILGRENSIENLFVNTTSPVLIDDSLQANQQINIFCHHLLLQNNARVNAQRVHILCMQDCVALEKSQIIADFHCEIRAGAVTHEGYIKSPKGSVQVVTEMYTGNGIITAKGKNGINIVTVGIQCHDENVETKSTASHLHGSIIRLTVGTPEKNTYLGLKNEASLGKMQLGGFISGKGLSLFANNVNFQSVKIAIQGNIILSVPYKIDVNEKTSILFNGNIISLCKFATWMDGRVKEVPKLEVYFEKIVDPDLTLTKGQESLSTLPHALTDYTETLSTQIEFLPILPKKEDYLFEMYDKSKLIPLETDHVAKEEKTPSQVVFSSDEYLSIKGNISLESAQALLQSPELDFFGEFSNISFFGSVQLRIKSTHLDLRDSVISTQGRGDVGIEAKNTTITESSIESEKIEIQTESLSFPASSDPAPSDPGYMGTTLSAEKINIKSTKDITIPKDSKLILKSPAPVTIECDNFYLRGQLEFEKLSIQAEHWISVFLAEMKGQELDLDAKYFVAFLSAFKVDKRFSVESVVSLIGFCGICSDYYANTSIVNLSASLYLPSTVSLSAKSMLGCFLAASNTLISILQLVLHEPTCQIALAAARVGLNAGPALFKTYQLVKNIDAAANNPNIKRRDLIEIANQAKEILLTLGSLAYTGTGIAKEFLHFPELKAMPAADSHWHDPLLVMKELNNIVTPLASTLLPGQTNSNFASLTMDFTVAPTSTTFSVFNIHGGIGCNLMTSNTTVAEVTLPLSLDVSPSSTHTSVVSVDSGQNSLLPSSERTSAKIIIGTGIPSLPRQTNLTTHDVIFVGDAQQPEFKNSSIKTDYLDIESGVRLSLNNSSLNVNDEINNSGETLFNESQVKAPKLDNHGFVEYVNTKVEIDETHDYKNSVTLAFGSDLKLQKSVDDQGAALQFVASHYNATLVEEQGLFAADLSKIEIKEAHFTKEAKFGARASTVHIEENDSAITLNVGLSNPSHVPHAHHHKHSDEKTKGFDYVDDGKLTATVTTQGIEYHSATPLTIKNIDLVSALPLSFEAPTLTISHHVTSTASLELIGTDTLKLDHASAVVNGQFIGKGNKINVENGTAVIAKNNIILDSKDKLGSHGKITIDKSSQTHHGFLGLDKTKNETVTTSYHNNAFISTDGDTLVHSGGSMALAGTDIKSNNITIASENNISITALQGTDSVTVNHSNPIQHDTSEQTVTTASPSHFSAEKNITISTPGDVKNLGTEFDAKGEIRYDLSDHSKIEYSALIETIHTKVTHSGLYMSLPSTGDALSQLPFVQNTKKLTHANSVDEKLSAVMNTSTEVINTTNKFLTSARKGGIFSGLKELLPNLDLNFRLGSSTSTVDYQRVGPGHISAEHFYIHAGEASFKNNFGIQAEYTEYDVGILNISGALLHQSVSSKDNFVLFSFSPKSILQPGLSSIDSFGVTHTDYQSSQNSWQGNAMHLGDFNVQAKDMSIDGTQISVKSISGNVNKMIADAEVNYSFYSAHQVGLYSSGQFSVGEKNGFSQTAATTSPFIGENKESYNTSHFSVGEYQVHGGTDGHIHADHTQFSPILEVKKDRDFHLSGSLLDLIPGSHSAAGPVFSNWDLYSAQRYYAAYRDQVLYNKNQHFGFTAPVYHAQAGKQFLDNINWLMAQDRPVSSAMPVIKMMPVASHPKPLKTHYVKTRAKPVLTDTKHSVQNDLDDIDFAKLYANKHDSMLIFDINDSESQPHSSDRESEKEGHHEYSSYHESEKEEHHERLFLTDHINYGLLAEVAEKDLIQYELWNHSFQKIANSSSLNTYLRENLITLGQSGAFRNFIDDVLDPIAASLFNRSSYLYSMYAQVDYTHFLSSEVFEQSNLLNMIEITAENFERSAKYATNLMWPLHTFYLSGVVLEDAYQFSKGESLLPLLKEDAYSTILGISTAALAESIVPIFTKTAENTIQFIEKMTSLETPWLYKSMSHAFKWSLPITGMIAGSLLGEYLCEEDQENILDITIGSAIARQAWLAGTLRDSIGDEFKETISPEYSADLLSSRSIDSYYNYQNILRNNSTPMGRSLIKPLSRDILEISQLADKFPQQTGSSNLFSIEALGENFMEYAALMEDTQFADVRNVDGEIFRDLIEHHSDFSTANINKLKFIGKSFFAVSAAESIYEVATSDDKLNTTAKLIINFGAAEAGGVLGASAGGLVCGPYAPLCVGAIALAGGIASVEIADKTWDNVLKDSHLIPEESFDSLHTAIGFFKPSKYLAHQEIEVQRLHQVLTPDRSRATYNVNKKVAN